MMQVIPFHPDHLYALIPETPERAGWEVAPAAHIHALDNGHAVTGLIDGKPVACGGLVLLWPGVAEGWLATTPAAVAHPTWLVRSIIRFIRAKIAELQIRRLQAHVDASFTRAWMWLERLGLQRESEMLRYGRDGGTYYMYVFLPQ